MLNPVSERKPRSSRAVVAALLAGTVIGAGAMAWSISGPSYAAPISVTPVNPQAGFAPLVAKVKSAVVQIATISRPEVAADEETSDGQDQNSQATPNLRDLPAPFGDMLRQFGQRGGNSIQRPQQRALGSGFIIDPAGYVVTNNHVVAGATQVSVTLNDGTKLKARIIGRDTKTDLALLKVDAGHELPYVAFGDSDKELEGDWVIAVGNPYGLGGTVTAGIVSAHGRNINSGPYDDFLQIDAPINPGNSGGPLFNQAGQVVGIDTAIYSPTGGSVGIGFAIPSNVAKNIVAQLRDHRAVARGWLGISMQPLTASLAHAVGLPNDNGVLVNTVTPDSPAAHASLQQGDVITAFDGKAIKGTRDLAMAAADTASGKTVALAVWRDNHAHTVNVTMGTENTTKVASAVDRQPASAAAPALPHPVGMSLAPLSSDSRQQLHLDDSAHGVLVNSVTEGGNADESGVQSGDIIERVGNRNVSTPSEVVDALRIAEQQKKPAVELLMKRNGRDAFLGLQLAES